MFVDRVDQARKSIKDSATSITLEESDVAHLVLVVLYDDTRLLSREFAPDGNYRRKRLRREDEEAYQDAAQKVEALEKRFEEWLSRYLPLPAITNTDVFDISGFMDGRTELFRSSQPGHYLRLIADIQSNDFTTLSDASVQIKLEPRKIKRLERVSAQGGAVGIVTIFYHPTEEGKEGKVWTVVLENAGSMSGWQHARRLYRRLSIRKELADYFRG